MPLGSRIWVIPEGYLPAADDDETDRRHVSHEAACILNTDDRPADVRITVYFTDREPVGPYRVTVPARRTLHLRYDDLDDPAPLPRDTDYASVIEADREIVVQYTRLDARRGQRTLLSTMAYPAARLHG